MQKKMLSLVLPALLLFGLAGCGPAEVVSTSPVNNAQNVPVTIGQGVDFSTNTITVTFDKSVYISPYSSEATIAPVPVAISTAAAHTGALKLVSFTDNERILYLYYDSGYKLTANTTHTINVEGLWNSSAYMGQKSLAYSFLFHTQ